MALSLSQGCTTQLCLLLLRHISLIFEECVRNNEEGLGRNSEIITSKNRREKIGKKKNRRVCGCVCMIFKLIIAALFFMCWCARTLLMAPVLRDLFQRGLCVLPFVSLPENIAQWCKNRSSWRSYMYLSSDSLRTRTSLIRSIRHSSPSMSWTAMAESAIEMTSSAAMTHKQKQCATAQATKPRKWRTLWKLQF